MSDQDFDFESLLGEEFGPFHGWEKVNAAMIRHWCEAMGDKNPIYTDPEAAQAAGYDTKGVVAPPTMMQAWNMPGYTDSGPPSSDARNPFAVIMTLREAGYPSTLAVNSEQDYERVVEEGDTIYHRAHLEHISEEKTTALGTGFFITQLCTYYNQRDEVVGHMRWRVLQFRAHGTDDSAATGGGEAAAELPRGMRRMRPVRNRDNAYFWEGVDAGELRLQRCGGCGVLRHPPGPMCPHCRSLDWEVSLASGRGELYSYVVMHYPEIPPFDYPHLIALVSLEEGPRLVANLVGIKRRDVHIGMAVQTVFEEVEEGLILPQFRPLEVL